MNSLSWMIYAADVTGSVSAVLTTTSVFSMLGGIVTFCFTSVSHNDRYEFGRAKGEKPEPSIGVGWRAAKPLLIVAFASAMIACVIPGRNTIYAIAASEVGEQALKSQTANKAMQALNAWLDRQIAGEKPEASK